ncbi:MAG: S16 family serine protease [Acidilobus sp.]
MKDLVALSLAALFLLATAAPLASAQQLSWSRTTWVLLPAVYGNSGVVINVTVTLTYPGSGQVSVTDNSGQVGGSTLYSMEMAYMVAMVYAGLNWENYNLQVHINATGKIEGPSGSFGVMLATFALATGLSDNALHRYAITGAVSPSGLSGPIGGLTYKCEAAASQGLGIVYPVGNQLTALEACNDTDKVPVAGLLEALGRVFGTYPFSSNVSVKAPQVFNKVMVNVTSYFVNYTEEVLHEASSALRELSPSASSVLAEVQQFVNDSEADLGLAERYVESLPYAAASLAFTAYVNALAANYTLWALRVLEGGGSASSFLEGQATSIYSQALSMMSSAESYVNRSSTLTFDELMATAFARLADALYYASYAGSIAGQVNSSSLYLPAYYLAMAKARILSAIGWLMEANASLLEGPNLTSSLITSTATAVGQFTDVGIKYADSLIAYYVNQLESMGDYSDAAILQAMESDLNFLVSEGDKLLSQGQYLAAIGVYEDALTNALNIIFIETRSFSSSYVTSSYANELEMEYTTLAVDLAKRGLLSSIDSAYMGYASALLPTDPQDAINIMEAAVIDELTWYLGVISYSQARPEIIQQIASTGASVAGTALLALAALALGALLTASAALWSYKRSLRALSGPGGLRAVTPAWAARGFRTLRLGLRSQPHN